MSTGAVRQPSPGMPQPTSVSARRPPWGKRRYELVELPDVSLSLFVPPLARVRRVVARALVDRVLALARALRAPVARLLAVVPVALFLAVLRAPLLLLAAAARARVFLLALALVLAAAFVFDRLVAPVAACCSACRSLITRFWALRRFLRAWRKAVSRSLSRSRVPFVTSRRRSRRAFWAASIDSCRRSSDPSPLLPALDLPRVVLALRPFDFVLVPFAAIVSSFGSALRRAAPTRRRRRPGTRSHAGDPESVQLRQRYDERVPLPSRDSVCDRPPLPARP